MLSVANAATARTNMLLINIPLRILLSGLHLRRHQTDFVDSGSMGDVDCLGHPLEIQGGVALHEYHTLRTRLEDLFQTAAQTRLIGELTVYGHIVIGIYHTNHFAL